MKNFATISVRRRTYEQVRRLARLERRSLSEVLALAIEARLRAITPKPEEKTES